MRYRTEKYTVCRRVCASFSPEIVRAGAVKGLKTGWGDDGLEQHESWWPVDGSTPLWPLLPTGLDDGDSIELDDLYVGQVSDVTDGMGWRGVGTASKLSICRWVNTVVIIVTDGVGWWKQHRSGRPVRWSVQRCYRQDGVMRSWNNIKADEIQTQKRFKQTLIYFDTDTQYANFRGNPFCQAAKRHLNNRWTARNNQLQPSCS